MTTALDAIDATRIIVSLPPLGNDSSGTPRSAARVPVVVEVCVQEGLDVIAVPVSHVELLDAMAPFEGRAVFGVTGVLDADDLRAAADRGAGFVVAHEATPDLVALAAELGVPMFACAMTPGEIRATARLSPYAIVCHPAEVLGTLYAPHAIAAAPRARLIAGGVNSYVAQQWLLKGAYAALTDESFIGDTLVDGNLAWLRDRARTFATEGRAAPTWVGSSRGQDHSLG